MFSFTQGGPVREQKEEGSIASLFTSLSGEAVQVLPDHFADLKREIWKDSLVQSWREVLFALEKAVDEVAAKGGSIIPRIAYDDIVKGLSPEQVTAVKRTGTLIVTGGVSKEEALTWKQCVKDYIDSNPVKGFPPENIQVYEIYNSKAQIAARTHPAIIKTQRFLLSLWHNSTLAADIDLSTPISYFDRLRIRTPGDASFTLGPHIDGGSVERWEDPQFRKVWGKILEGGSGWEAHDSFDASPRLDAKQDLYNAPNQCSVFRCWQGWTSLSTVGPGEGTLRVLPMLSLASAYILLRPFFRPKPGANGSLAFDDWELDIESTSFPGSIMGKTQELNETTHPHLRLDKTMISVPAIEPGDQVYWHCDVVHAVEPLHRGNSDSSVFYIPAVPLTIKNASYLRDQRTNFLRGLPPPDFPGGEGESRFTGRANAHDVQTSEARQALGLEPFADSSSMVTIKANRILF
ncbi:hypothetical protein PILCRDRAFT_825084 [Piloderma croceum F 1598]|uniref:DUF1479-domain-containing protein n=1 Tax=Piloderma croceum (strain F 1598) TaxID=765440 RepID=A0A0C3EZ96_PILCF|nr:hypothetical protein PILCRDRAFT_825084 [Piloderma croceum F 1598]